MVDGIELLRLITEDVRWRLLEELSRSDRTVQELVDHVEEPQNLVSYHLGRLRKAGVVHERRSSADGRDVYYRLDLERFTAAVCRPASAIQPSFARLEPSRTAAAAAGPKRTVLFVCTGNSTRSQMAEAFMRRLSREVHASSAGTKPRPVHPMTVRVLQELGARSRGLRSKPVEQLSGRRFDYLVTLCDRAREVCRDDLVDAEEVLHWSIPDPASSKGSEDFRYQVFREVALDISGRVRQLMARIRQDRPAAIGDAA